MITARQILEFYYEYATAQWSKEPVPVFKNPDSSDLKELKGFVKFVADAKKKEVYVWRLKDGPLHGEVIKQFKLPRYNEKHVLASIAERVGSNYSVQFWDLMNNYEPQELRDKFTKLDWSWLGKYHFNMTQFVSDANYNLPGIFRT